MNKPLIIWDFDDTLIDTRSAATNYFLDGLGVYLHEDLASPPHRDALFKIITSSDNIARDYEEKLELVNEYLESKGMDRYEISPKLIGDMIDYVYARQDNMFSSGEAGPFEGVIDTLSVLCDRGYDNSIASNGNQKKVFAGLDAYNMRQYFKGGIFPRTVNIEKKPAPDLLLYVAQHNNRKPEDCIYIGDSVQDVQAAVAAGMRVMIFIRDKNDVLEIDKFEALGAKVFHSHKQLLGMIDGYGDDPNPASGFAINPAVQPRRS